MPSPPASVPGPAGVLSGVSGDLRHAFRLLWKGKGLSATTLLTLALCIGATTAIFSTVYALLLKPLPFPEPDRIVELYSSATKAGLNKMPANVPFYLDYSKNASSYEAIALWSFSQQMFGEDEAPVRLPMASATAEIFSILRVQPLLGEFFTKEQNRPGADKVVVLTQSFWRTQFAEDPGIVGRTVRIAGEPHTVVGVAPRGFEAWDARVKYVVPLSWQPAQENPQGRYGVGIPLFGRLQPGVAAGQADAEAKTLEQRYVDAAPPQVKGFVERSGMTMNVGGVQEQRVRPVRPTLLLLQGGVAFVLLIGCMNVANLLLVRANARQAELAIRSALGAGRGAIARQLILESLLLTSLGAALGLGLAWGALRASNFYLAKFLPQALPATLDLRVLGFAAGLSVVLGVLIFLFDAGTMEQAVGGSFDQRRAVMLLLAAFAGLALFLSSLGIYGVLAYDVAQRTREIGVRGAVGAAPGQIVGLILRQGLGKTGLGIGLGLVGAFLVSRSMTSLLFGVTPTEPAVYATVAAVLAGVALLASYLPARRAARIDPLVALRDE